MKTHTDGQVKRGFCLDSRQDGSFSGYLFLAARGASMRRLIVRSGVIQ